MLGPDGEEYWTTKQAAEAMDVTLATIGGWRRKGYLTPHPDSPKRHPVYAQLDVSRAEKMAYDAAIRTSGSAKRSSRRFDLPNIAA